jgi:sRNA-binding protein
MTSPATDLSQRSCAIAKQQNTFAKKQREQEKKRKTEDKRRRRDDRKTTKATGGGPSTMNPADRPRPTNPGTAERLNFDEFDLLCRAADVACPVSSATLAEGLTGVNAIARAKASLPALVTQGFLEAVGTDLYEISPAGVKALS